MDDQLQKKYNDEFKEKFIQDVKGLAYNTAMYVPALANSIFAFSCGYTGENTDLLPYTSGGLVLTTGILNGIGERNEDPNYHPWDTPITSIVKRTAKNIPKVGLDAIISYALGKGAKAVVDYF